MPAGRARRISGDRGTDDDKPRSEGNDKSQATEHLKQGLGLLFQAAREAATGVKKELDRSDWTKTLDDAGRELVRATANVVERVGTEIKAEIDRVRDPARRPSDPTGHAPPPAEARAPDDHRPPPEKPKGPTPADPGFRIVIDDEPPKGGDKGGEGG